MALAGDKRTELDKVIQHYSKDKEHSLKLKAATFLIENMSGHYSCKDTVYVNTRAEKVCQMSEIMKTKEIKIHSPAIVEMR